MTEEEYNKRKCELTPHTNDESPNEPEDMQEARKAIANYTLYTNNTIKQLCNSRNFSEISFDEMVDIGYLYDFIFEQCIEYKVPMLLSIIMDYLDYLKFINDSEKYEKIRNYYNI